MPPPAVSCKTEGKPDDGIVYFTLTKQEKIIIIFGPFGPTGMTICIFITVSLFDKDCTFLTK